MHTDYNDKFNNILMDLVKNMYEVYGTSDMTKSFEVTVQLDANQRIASMNNMKVDGQLKAPSKELITLVERLNNIAEEFLTLPEIYRLKECYFSVQAGGKINIQPVYLNNS